MGTIELLVRTHFTLVAATSGTQLKDVVGYGSGFMMSYKGYRFFVTAAHVIEPTWSTQSKKEIDIRGNDAAIVTHIAQEYNGVKQTVYVPLGGFVYINKIQVDPNNPDLLKMIQNAEQNPTPVDVAIAMVEERPGVYSFSGGEEPGKEGEDWEAKPKVIIPYEAVVEPDCDDHYFVYGRVKFDNRKDEAGHPYVYSEPRCHPDMEYLSTIQDNFHVFKATKDIDYDEWAGISGSPVLNPHGEIVGIASSVLPGTPHMFALDIKTARPFFDVLINARNI